MEQTVKVLMVAISRLASGRGDKEDESREKKRNRNVGAEVEEIEDEDRNMDDKVSDTKSIPGIFYLEKFN